MRANLDIKNRHFECGRHKIQVGRIMRSYHLPACVDRPTEDDQVERIRQVKRLEVQGGVVKFRFKSRQAEPGGARAEPSLPPRREERPVTPERERSRGRSRQPRRRRDKSPASMPMAARPATAAKGEVPQFPSGPPPAAPTQRIDVQYFGRKSRRMKAILEREDGIGAGPQYLGQDGVPITFKLYFGTRLQGPTKDSKKVDRAVCECGKVLKPNEGSLWHTCMPSTAYRRSCGRSGMSSTRFGGKNLLNRRKLRSLWKAGLLRRPQGHPDRTKRRNRSRTPSQGPTSQEVNQWFSGPLKRGPRKGSEIRSLMTMRTSGARLTATGPVEGGTGVQPHGTMTLRVKRKKSRSNQRLTEQPDGNGQRWRPKRKPVTTTCPEKQNDKRKGQPARPEATLGEVTSGSFSSMDGFKQAVWKPTMTRQRVKTWWSLTKRSYERHVYRKHRKLRKFSRVLRRQKPLGRKKNQPQAGQPADLWTLDPPQRSRTWRSGWRNSTRQFGAPRRSCGKGWKSTRQGSEALGRLLRSWKGVKKQSIGTLSRPESLPICLCRRNRRKWNENSTTWRICLLRPGVKCVWGQGPETIHTGQCPRKRKRQDLLDQLSHWSAGPTLPLVSMDWFEIKGSPTDEQTQSEAEHGFVQCLLV